MGLQIDGHFLPTALEGPCRGHVCRRAGDDPMSCEFHWSRRRACLFKVSWSRHYHARNPRDELRRSAGIDQLAQPDSHIDRITHQVPPRILEQEMDVEIRMLCGEHGKTRDDRADSKARGRAHPQYSTKIPAPANAVF